MTGDPRAFVAALIRRDLRVRLRDPWPLALWLLIPLVIGGMITAIGGRDGPKPVARLVLVDQDQSLASGLLGGAFTQGALASLIELQSAAEAEARRQLDEDEVSAMLIVPAGFQDALLTEAPLQLELLTNPSQRILPGIIEGVLAVLVDGVFYLHRLFGPQLQALADLIEGAASPDDATVAGLSVGINQAVAAIEPYLETPVLEVEFEPTGGAAEPGPGFGVLFFPGIVLMALMFAAQSLSDDFWKERQAGTLRRLALVPHAPGWLVAAKAASVALLLLGVCLVLLAIGFGYHGLAFSRVPLSLAWLAAGGVFLYALLAAIAIHAPSRKSASVLTTAAVFPLLMAGGSFFPFEAMPGWLAAIGRWLPNGYVLSQFKDYLLGRSGSAELLAGVPFLALWTLPLLALCSWRLKRFARLG